MPPQFATCTGRKTSPDEKKNNPGMHAHCCTTLNRAQIEFFKTTHTKIQHFFRNSQNHLRHRHSQVDGEDENELNQRRQTVQPRCRFHIHKIFRPNRRAVSLLFEFIFLFFRLFVFGLRCFELTTNYQAFSQSADARSVCSV